MAVDPTVLSNWEFAPVSQSYDARDAILYALGVGLGKDPLDAHELQYVYEQDLATLPTFAVTLSTLGMWVRDPATGITWKKLVHSGQKSTFHKPLPAVAKVIGHARISDIWDRGEEKGAVIVVERKIHDADSGDCYCTLEQTLMLRADGGFGGNTPPPPAVTIPERDPDKVICHQTSPGQAILYRLNGDWNPLHVDPQVASQAGFTQPILHGYCSYGIAGWEVCQAAAQDCAQLKQLECQFSGPVIPGDELIFKFWEDSANVWIFQAYVNDKLVLNRGRAVFTAQ